MKKYFAMFGLIALLLLLVISLGISAISAIGFNNAEKVFKKAIEENHPSLCENILVIPRFKFYDIKDISEDIEDIVMYFLQVIPEHTSGSRDGCYWKIAQQTNDLKICDLVIQQGKCYTSLVMEKVKQEIYSGCPTSFRPTSMVKESYEACYKRTIVPAVISLFRDICEQAPDSFSRDDCYFSAVDQIEKVAGGLAPTKPLRFYTYLCDQIQNHSTKELCQFVTSYRLLDKGTAK